MKHACGPDTTTRRFLHRCGRHTCEPGGWARCGPESVSCLLLLAVLARRAGTRVCLLSRASGHARSPGWLPASTVVHPRRGDQLRGESSPGVLYASDGSRWSWDPGLIWEDKDKWEAHERRGPAFSSVPPPNDPRFSAPRPPTSNHPLSNLPTFHRTVRLKAST